MWFFKFLVFVACCLSAFSDEIAFEVIEESEIDKSLAENIVLYGIISELASQTNVSSKCAAELTNIFRSINRHDLWAIKVMDASGTFQSSFVWGQNAWLGSKQSCDFLNNAPKFTISPDVPKFMDKDLISTISQIEVDFKMIFMIIISPYQVDPIIKSADAKTHQLGLCLPKTCSNEDITFLSKSFFSQRKLRFQSFYNASIEVINVRNMDIKNFLNRPDVSGIFFSIVAVTTLVVLFSFSNRFVENTNLNELKRFLKCFSIHDNVASIYNTSSSPNSITSINGLRTLICVWVVLSHCCFYTMFAYDNLPVLMAALELIGVQPILAGTVYVDTFFVLGALLLVYNFLKDERTIAEIRNNSYIGNVTLLLKKIIHRYIRLTPAFIFIIGIGHILAVYMQESSSFYIDETFDIYCTPKSFWYSVFYINNLFEVKDSCLSWSWYIACDMQFYIIILFNLFVYARNPAIAKTIFVALFAVLTACILYLNVDMNVLPRMDSVFYHANDFYIVPWNRMPSYFAGCTVGYIMFRMKDKNFPKNRYINISYWTITFTIMIGTLFVTSFKESSALNFALGLSLGRYFFGLFIGSLVVMCHFGYGGIVNNIFSSRFFAHANKVTYSIYLIHPVLIIFFNITQESIPHFDVASSATKFFATTLLSYVAAIVLSPIMEIPFQKLSDEYVMKKSKTKK